MKQLMMFGVVFGFLLIAQFYLLINKSVFNKQQSKPEAVINEGKTKFLDNFTRRLKMAWVMLIVMGLAFTLGFFGLTIFFMLVSFLALREFVSIMHLKPSDYWPIFCSFYIFLPLQYFFVLTDLQFLFFIFIPVYVFLLSPILSVLAKDDDQFFERASKFQWSQLACVYCLSYLPAIAGMSLKGDKFQSTTMLIYFIAVISASDSFQYIFGNLFGKKKVAPSLSPK
jgi:phosphatidate cytidylyltransferase